MQREDDFDKLRDIALYVWSHKIFIIFPVVISICAGLFFLALTPSRFESQIKYEVNAKFIENKQNSRLFISQKYREIFYSKDVIDEFHSKNSRISKISPKMTPKETSADKPFEIGRSTQTIEFIQTGRGAGGSIKIRSNNANIISEVDHFTDYVNAKLTNLIKSRAEEQISALPAEAFGPRDNANALIIAINDGETALLLSDPTKPVLTYPKPKKIIFSFGSCGLFVGIILLIFIPFVKAVMEKFRNKTVT